MWPSSGWYILLGRSTHTERCFCRKSSGMCGQGIRWNQVNFIDGLLPSRCHPPPQPSPFGGGGNERSSLLPPPPQGVWAGDMVNRCSETWVTRFRLVEVMEVDRLHGD